VGGVRNVGGAGGVEAPAEAGVLEGEFFVFAFEGADAFLGLEDEAADGGGVAPLEGALHFDEFVHQGGGIHGHSPGVG
jgi:hypothetical protein